MEFPVTLAWAVASIEVAQPAVSIGSVDFPLALVVVGHGH